MLPPNNYYHDFSGARADFSGVFNDHVFREENAVFNNTVLNLNSVDVSRARVVKLFQGTKD